MVLISTNYRNIVLVTHQFDAAIKVVIFENSLPTGNVDFTETWGLPAEWEIQARCGQ